MPAPALAGWRVKELIKRAAGGSRTAPAAARGQRVPGKRRRPQRPSLEQQPAALSPRRKNNYIKERTKKFLKGKNLGKIRNKVKEKFWFKKPTQAGSRRP